MIDITMYYKCTGQYVMLCHRKLSVFDQKWTKTMDFQKSTRNYEVLGSKSETTDILILEMVYFHLSY